MKAVDGLKKCSKCGEVKGVEEFGKDKNRSDGLYHMCKSCKSRIDKLYSIRVVDRRAETNRLWYIRMKGRLDLERRDVITSLGDWYIKTKLSQKLSVSFKDIPPQMIELKRTQLINKRLLKKLKENETK